MAKTRAFLPEFGIFRYISVQFCEIHVVSANLQRFGLETGKVMITVQAVIKISPAKTINQLQTRKRKLDKKKIYIIMTGRKEGCTKDYALVLEADNKQGSCKLSLHSKLTICENHSNPNLYPRSCSQ